MSRGGCSVARILTTVLMTALLLITTAPASAQLVGAGGFGAAGGGGSGTVTSIATTSPITGGTITTTGNVACATCATASSLTTNILPKIGTSPGLSNSLATDNGTTLTYTGTGGISATAFATTGTATGQISLSGATSGTAIIKPQDVAGTPTLTLGTSSGTPVVTASSPLAVTTATGNITCSTCSTLNSFTLAQMAGGSSNLLANTYYTLGGDGTVQAVATSSRFRLPLPVACTLKAVYWYVSPLGTLGTVGQTVNHQVLKNGVTLTTGVAFDYSTDPSSGAETGLSLAFAAGDTLEWTFTTPAVWTVPATGVRINVTAYFSVP